MRFLTLVMTVALTLLITIGIALFFMRAQIVPKTIGHEQKIRPQPSTDEIINNQFLLLIHKAHVDKLDSILKPLALEVKMPILNWLLVAKKGPSEPQVVQLGEDAANEARLTLNSLLQHPLVLDAHHNYVMDNTSLKGYWSFPKAWPLGNASEHSPLAMNLPLAWQISTGSPDITISIVDQFVSNNQFSFQETFSACNNRVSFFTPFYELKAISNELHLPHGDLMLQALGACNEIEAYRNGIDYQAKLFAFDRPNLGHAETFLTALVASGIDVCKQSIIPCPPEVHYTLAPTVPDILLLPFGNHAPDLLQFTSDMILAINQKNIIIVTSAGNDASDADSFFPGGSPTVINVGASNKEGMRADFSNWGPAVDLLAPGDDIEMSFPNGPKKIAGTSISAAYVAGAIALMKSVNKDLVFKQAEHILKNSAASLSCEQYCPTFYDSKNNPCSDICCRDLPLCGKLALDIKQAVLYAKNNITFPPLLSLDKNYLLYLRDEIEPKEIVVHNVGDVDTKVNIKVFDDNIEIRPQHLWLSRKGMPRSQETLSISFRKEPFKRQTFKIELEAMVDERIVDRTEFYMEFIPKRATRINDSL